MSKERKFHELIEQQNQEAKARAWGKICAKEAEQTEMEESAPVQVKRTPFLWKRWLSVAVASLIVVAVGVFAIVKFLPNTRNEPETIHYNRETYQEKVVEYTIEEHVQETGKPLLCFTGAENYERVTYVYELKDSKEIICYCEEVTDINTGDFFILYITDERTRLDILAANEASNETDMVGGIKIDWRSADDKAFANFEYQGHRYHLQLFDPIDDEHILTLVEELIP